MKQVLILIACIFLVPVVWADAPPPPVPVPGGDNSDQLPPLDVNQLTPLPIVPAQGTPNAQPVQEEKQAPTSTPIPPPPQAPTATPIQQMIVTATPTKELKAKATPTSEPEQVPSTGAAPTGALTDYFPATEGDQWSYQYLKPGEGQTTKETFTVKCTNTQTMSNGTIRVVFETTEDGQSTRDRYSLYDNKVKHTASGDQPINGDYVFKVPGTVSKIDNVGEGPFWTVVEKSGTVHKSKAAFGEAQVYQKTYPDCVIVTEKILKGGKASNTILYYYAKGIGLVSMEVYSSAMKLIQTKSFALVSGPGAQ